MKDKKLYRMYLETIHNSWTEDHWLEDEEAAQKMVDEFNSFLRPGETMRLLTKVEEVTEEESGH